MRLDNLASIATVLGGEHLEEVDSYVYLFREVNMRYDEGGEIFCRIRAGRNKFTELTDVRNSPLDQKIKAHYFSFTALPAMKYWCENCSLTNAEYNLAAAEKPI